MTTTSINLTNERTRSVFLEVTFRTLCAICYLYFCYAALTAYLANRSLPVLLLLLAETLTFFLIITARFPKSVDRSIYASAIVIAASFYFLVIDLSHGVKLLSIYIIIPLQITGILTQIAAKLSLARSFGLLPANRGIVQRGPYGLVRHPMYLGYFLNHLGFLLALWSWHNLLVYTGLYLLQFLRIMAEERVLLTDPAYQNYAQRVRYRMIPFVL